jgi:hypothetical protein
MFNASLDIPMSSYLEAGKWNHVELGLNLSPAGQAPIVRFNGTNAVPGGAMLLSSITPGPITVKLGATVLNSPLDTIGEHYDNVVVRAQ